MYSDYLDEYSTGKYIVVKDIEEVEDLERYDKKIKLCPLLCKKRSLVIINENTNYIYGILETRLDDETLEMIRKAVYNIYNYYDTLFVELVLIIDPDARFVEVDNGVLEWYI